jgi:hypothetical protein
VDKRTYRVTALVGGWRSLPWPFGLLDIEDDDLTIRSWHWSWWVQDQRVARSDIEGIEVSRRFGVVQLALRVKSGRPWKVRIANSQSSQRVLRDLSTQGYLDSQVPDDT